MTAPRIEFIGVGKRYGAKTAVEGVSLAVGPGECFALVGHNGAGKTTLMKLALGLTRPTGGSLRVLGSDPAAAAAVEARRGIGFLPEDVRFHESMTGREVLAFYARLKAEPVPESFALLDRVGLAGVADDRVKTYSKGMRQRLGLAQALLGAPRLLLLDEPTGGLDPMFRNSFYEIIQELKAAGATVVLSSHVLTELEARTDRLGIMNEGRLAACGSLSELRRAAGLPLRIRLAVPGGDGAAIAERLGHGFGLCGVNGCWVELACTVDDKMDVLRRVATLGVDVEDIDIVPPTLDDVYAHFGNGKVLA